MQFSVESVDVYWAVRLLLLSSSIMYALSYALNYDAPFVAGEGDFRCAGFTKAVAWLLTIDDGRHKRILPSRKLGNEKIRNGGKETCVDVDRSWCTCYLLLSQLIPPSTASFLRLFLNRWPRWRLRRGKVSTNHAHQRLIVDCIYICIYL